VVVTVVRLLVKSDDAERLQSKRSRSLSANESRSPAPRACFRETPVARR
jgi:hypothetical protein